MQRPWVSVLSAILMYWKIHYLFTCNICVIALEFKIDKLYWEYNLDLRWAMVMHGPYNGRAFNCALSRRGIISDFCELIARILHSQLNIFIAKIYAVSSGRYSFLLHQTPQVTFVSHWKANGTTLTLLDETETCLNNTSIWACIITLSDRCTQQIHPPLQWGSNR